MPKGKHLSAAAKVDIAEKVLHEGVDPKVVAEDLGITVTTVKRVVSRFRLAEQHDEERTQLDKQMVVAGNKHDGQLIKRAGQRDTYEGTCRLRNGKFERKRFHASGDIHANRLYEDWCERVRQEDALGAYDDDPFAKAAREPVTPEPIDEPEDEEPIDPEPVVETAEPLVDDVAEDNPQPVVESSSDTSHAVTDGTAYLVILMGENPRPYGLYDDFERAINECDTMNAALEFAGVGKLYDCMEVEWR